MQGSPNCWAAAKGLACAPATWCADERQWDMKQDQNPTVNPQTPRCRGIDRFLGDPDRALLERVVSASGSDGATGDMLCGKNDGTRWDRFL